HGQAVGRQQGTSDLRGIGTIASDMAWLESRNALGVGALITLPPRPVQALSCITIQGAPTPELARFFPRMPHRIACPNPHWIGHDRVCIMRTRISTAPLAHRWVGTGAEPTETTPGPTTARAPYGKQGWTSGVPWSMPQGVWGPLVTTGLTGLFGLPRDTAILHDTIMSTCDALHTHAETAAIAL